jgi:hypothetical protein
MSLLDTASLILTPNGYKDGVTTGKLYSVKPTDASGDMTVSRATTATRVNSAGLIELMLINVPRLDYPLLGGCPKILVEPLRTNFFLRSQEFNLTWVPVLANVTTNTTTAPDNTMTADKLVATNVNGTHFILQIAAGSINGTTVTASVFVQAAGLSNIQLFNNVTGGGQANFILSGAGSYTLDTGVSANIEAYPLGWYRCIMTFTPTTTGSFNIQIRLANSSGNISFTGNNVDGVYLWGAQIEEGTKPSSYIPTTTASVTRNADVISKTGISTLIGQTEGTIYAEINNTLMTSYSTGYVMRIFADANNEVWIRKESGTNKYTARWRANSVDVYTQSTIAVLNRNNKIAIAYKTGNSAVYLNGTQIGTSASAGAFSVAPSQIGIGSSSTADFFNDRIELATLFKTRLTNAQLATLTTL